ncbi:MAG: type II toxin-antitoxin system RelE/ParE family toxin [Ferruginibacter sp.]
MAKRKITWGKLAAREFNAAIKYIRKDSEQNADNVKEVILTKINGLTDNRVAHRKDPYKKNNDGKFLYFEILRYRIVYYATAAEVIIIRIRHTKREPKKY